MRTVTRFLAASALALAAVPQAVHAQDRPLDRVQNLIATGRFTDAAATLDRWEREFADPTSDAVPADRARALYMRGVITSDVQQAQDLFLGVVLSYPSSAVAPHALLRLGQALVTSGEPQRAIAYLERLRSDYPNSDARPTGMLWLARAQLANRSARAACEAARAGAAITTDENLSLLLELEQDRACGDAPPAVSQPGHGATVTRDVGAADVAAGLDHAASLNGDFAVQVAAFRELRSAQVIAGQLREAGIDARVVTVPASDLHRVRVGSFASAGDAAGVMKRVRDAGFAALLVNDARNERLVRDTPRR